MNKEGLKKISYGVYIINTVNSGCVINTLNQVTNDKITVENLLYGLMMRSGNDAAVALAEYVGGSIEGFWLGWLLFPYR